MKYIIFDLDGTLIDSMPVWEDTGRRFLENQGLPVPENLHQVVKTQTLPQTATYFREVLGVKRTQEEIEKEIISFIEDAYANHIPLKPYAREFLEQEKKKGTKMCILTASELNYVSAGLERLALLPYFEFIMTCTEVGQYKHDGEVFRLAMERLGGTLAETVVFEDALYAVQGAKKAGFTVYAIADPVTEADAQTTLGIADCRLKDYKPLLELT